MTTSNPTSATTLGHGKTPRPATLKRINRRRFLEELRNLGPSTRAELTRATGVAPPTSSSIIADLMETGWLETEQMRFTAKGRPGQIYKLASESSFMIGALIQIDQCLVAPAGLDGLPNLDAAVSFPTPATYEDLIEAITKATKEVQASRSGRCLGLGLGIPGLVDENASRIALSPNLRYLDGKSLGHDLGKQLLMDVVCTQEEHALCSAEQHLGQARNLRDYAVLDVSAGMGMGVVSGGHYLTGHQGYAGEIGHITVVPNGDVCGCGNRGCLETVATDMALLRRLGGTASFDKLTPSPELEKALDQTLDYLAIALAAVSNIFNPQAIFIHGRILDLGQDVVPRLIEKTKARSLSPSFSNVLVAKANGDKLYGALSGLLDRIFAAVGPRLS